MLSTVQEICGAIDIQTEDGSRIWCPPAWVAKQRGIPFEVTKWTITRPYWTSGPKCRPQTSGPELTDEEIQQYCVR